MKKIAFLASPRYKFILEKCPDFIDEFEVLKTEFARFGVKLIIADWQDQSIDWKSFDKVIPKACWDYSNFPKQFLSYLRHCDAAKVEFQNPIETLLWNMRKTYLSDLYSRGFNVGELKIIPENSKLCISEIQSELNPDKMLVIKPSVSGGAKNTIRCPAKELGTHEALLKLILSEADLIIQPYFSEIATEGEYSFFFFGNEFSHAILKKPAQGDFRAHQLFGGENLNYEPSLTEIKEAFKFTEGAPTPLAYARVDVFRSKGRFMLIELELIEPYLYFERAPKESLARFCEAVLR
jgi:glutathione synthase/RimK-type ligase-like ATP-grasp enzyme